jgi:hypothetical protein
MLTSKQIANMKSVLDFANSIARQCYEHQIPATLKDRPLGHFYGTLLPTSRDTLNATVYIAMHSQEDSISILHKIRKGHAIEDIISLLMTDSFSNA